MARAPSGAAVGASPEYTRTPVRGFPILLTDLATIMRNTCTLLGVDDASPFTITTQPPPFSSAPWGVWRTSRCNQYEELRCPDSQWKYQ